MRDGIVEVSMDVFEIRERKKLFAECLLVRASVLSSTRSFGAKRTSAIQIQTSRLPLRQIKSKYHRITNNQVNVDPIAQAEL